MKRFYIFSIIIISLFCLSNLAFGQQIEAPAGVPKDFGSILGKIADAVGTLIASLGAAMIVVAGILYLTSAGSPERIGTAKKALIYAIVGIAIGLAAKEIVNIVLDIMK